MSHGRELFERLRALDLRTGDYAIFGSGPLLVRGVIDAVNDLDVLCRGEAWNTAQRIGSMIELDEGVEVASVESGTITFGTRWAYGDFDIDDLIDTAEVIDGLPFVALEHVVAFKLAADRPKDREHLARLEAMGYWSPDP